MTAQALIDRLDRVKSTGRGTWLACCPAHEDRRPSMTIRETDDGRVLLHCFAGCGVEDVLGAVGLEFDALFPPKPLGDRVERVRRPFPAADVLAALWRETAALAVCSAVLEAGERLLDDDRERLIAAGERIEEARRLIDA